MQSSVQTFQRATVARAQAVRPSKRSAVRCQALHDVKKMARDAALATAAAALLLGQPNMAEARVPPPSAFSQSRASEEELLSILKSRGTDFSSLQVKDSPKGEAAAESKGPKAFALDKSVEVAKVEVVAPAPVPEPVREEAPAAPAPAPAAPVVVEVVVAEKKAAPVVVEVVEVAPAAPAVVAEEAGENSNAVILGGLALAAVVGVAALGSQQQQEQAPAESAPATAAPAAGASDVPANVAEARAWIAAWRARTQK